MAHLSIGYMTALGVLLASIAGCASGRAHENFLNSMQRQVGRSTDDPNVPFNRYREDRGSAKALANGNIEQQYRFRPDCQVYFEISKEQQRIVGWRYEGSKETCYATP